jgi:hypothetical protein
VDLRDTDAVEASEKTGTHELCAVVYDVNVLGRVPNFMKVLLRRPQRGGDNTGGRALGARGGASREGIIRRWDSLKKKHNRELSIGSPMRSLKMMWSQVSTALHTIVCSSSSTYIK